MRISESKIRKKIPLKIKFFFDWKKVRRLFVLLKSTIKTPPIKLKTKAKNPPRKFGSNQVESMRPMCGSQPFSCIRRTSKLGKNFSCKKPRITNANEVPIVRLKILDCCLGKSCAMKNSEI